MLHLAIPETDCPEQVLLSEYLTVDITYMYCIFLDFCIYRNNKELPTFPAAEFCALHVSINRMTTNTACFLDEVLCIVSIHTGAYDATQRGIKLFAATNILTTNRCNTLNKNGIVLSYKSE